MTTGAQRAAEPGTGPEDEAPLPTLAEQMADQLGGWRGLVESSIPVVVFVVANVVGELRPAVIASVSVALLIAALRLVQRRPVRHAVNGLFGIGIGAAIAWRTGDERDFYLPGILYGIGYGLALLVSAAVKQPLVGWIWSVLVAKGRSEWRDDPRLVRTFTQLTVLWGVVWLAKVGVQAGLYLAHQDTALGVARLALGYPPYALLLLITVWTVRRVTRERPAAGQEPTAAPEPLPGG
ncbi:DUF3159 domain-containing protein [Micromonospora sp. PTRAS2]